MSYAIRIFPDGAGVTVGSMWFERPKDQVQVPVVAAGDCDAGPACFPFGHANGCGAPDRHSGTPRCEEQIAGTIHAGFLVDSAPDVLWLRMDKRCQFQFKEVGVFRSEGLSPG